MQGVITTSLATLLSVVFLAGCSVDAEIEVTEPSVYHCLDVRDGEKFTFDNRTARDGRATVNDACVTVEDADGGDRRICRSHLDTWLKCKKASE